MSINEQRTSRVQVIKLDITRFFHSRHLLLCCERQRPNFSLRTPTHELLFTNPQHPNFSLRTPNTPNPNLFTDPRTPKIHNMSAQAAILPTIIQQDSRLLVSLTSYESSITENKNDILWAMNQLVTTIRRDLAVDLKVLGYTSCKNKFASVRSSPLVRHMKPCMSCNACRRSSYSFRPP
jgi:hypothetical protein